MPKSKPLVHDRSDQNPHRTLLEYEETGVTTAARKNTIRHSVVACHQRHCVLVSSGFLDWKLEDNLWQYERERHTKNAMCACKTLEIIKEYHRSGRKVPLWNEENKARLLSHSNRLTNQQKLITRKYINYCDD